MAYKPSKRTRRGSEWVDANITPMMNLMVVLIPLLLTSAEFVKLGVIELNLPPAAMGPEGQLLSELPQENIKRLDLSVSVTDRGFFISSSFDVLRGDVEGEPSIPLVNGEYDFQALSMKLMEVKRKAENRFPDANQIIIIAEQDIDYQTLISTMDATRLIRINGINEVLFPDVSLSAGIF
jgi:biopolymer transport protein ExbD